LELGFGGPTMMFVALIVVLLSVPSTSTVSPWVTALAVAAVVPCSYFVDDVSLTVTFCPVGVTSVKPEPERLLTVPIDPPAAGPDREFDPPPPDPVPPDPVPPAKAPECGPAFAAVAGTAAAALEPPLEEALMIPKATPPITRAAIAAARSRIVLREKVRSWENIRSSSWLVELSVALDTGGVLRGS
jgi:hypothetical protein